MKWTCDILTAVCYFGITFSLLKPAFKSMEACRVLNCVEQCNSVHFYLNTATCATCIVLSIVQKRSVLCSFQWVLRLSYSSTQATVALETFQSCYEKRMWSLL